ncbi:hypothetical protein MAIT1_01362 [Magnetofaba australis IT-1]|uniref:AB hydrolase-1 domain-containing protein n=2 Tax=Magnetofaba TaxID=1472292 RepID=A0A1Y2K2J8_9PROT|nr:hypothetical protein MAIT1_01362 [Magnetofaba australis IT-1]
MGGGYLTSMADALEAAGVGGVAIADPARWSRQSLLLDGLSAALQRNRDAINSQLPVRPDRCDQVNLIGYSYGGVVAAQAALDLADGGARVEHLILLATPLSADLLQQARRHPNIRQTQVMDLVEYGDPLFAGMSWPRLLASAPTLLWQFWLFDRFAQAVGHYAYADDLPSVRARHRAWSRRLVAQGVR